MCQAAQPGHDPVIGTRTVTRHQGIAMNKSHTLLVAAWPLLALATTAGFSAPASAQSLLDKLRHATQEIQQATQAVKSAQAAKQQVQQAQEGGQGQAGTQRKNCGALGAGCLDYMDTVTACTDQLNGDHAKMWADVIDERLASGKGVTAAQRQNLEEDLAAYRAAEAKKTDVVDARISGRMFEDLPKDDQIEANRRYGVRYNEVMSKCNGADHMGVVHTTKLDYLHGAGPARPSSGAP
jgi:hypothetical protein